MRRGDLCDSTCTVDCGHCKGNHTARYGHAIATATSPHEMNRLADDVARSAHLGTLSRADVELLQVTFARRCRQLFPAVFR